MHLIYSLSVSCFNSLVPGPVLVEYEYPVVTYNLTTYKGEFSGKTDTKLGNKLVSKIILEVIRTVKGVNWKLIGGGQLRRPQDMMPAFLPSTFLKIPGWKKKKERNLAGPAVGDLGDTDVPISAASCLHGATSTERKTATV